MTCDDVFSWYKILKTCACMHVFLGHLVNEIVKLVKTNAAGTTFVLQNVTLSLLKITELDIVGVQT